VRRQALARQRGAKVLRPSVVVNEARRYAGKFEHASCVTGVASGRHARRLWRGDKRVRGRS
jgi:hypothetical protein